LKHSTVYDCTLLQLPKAHNDAGNITAINSAVEIPFQINRIYYLYDVPGGEARGGHAHKKLQQLIVAASGSFDIILDDSKIKRTIHLNRPDTGLLMPSGLWRELDNFSSGAICLVLASKVYDVDDYIRDYSFFKTYKKIE
jgi:oxalate decarboxylase/phosphoglucose isomerase-like protein (cupin superfamily)